ncbi:MAG: GspH/FimT family pseudopilin [Planctomycetota bacterium]|jgi:prepilin-type N-terminal cleavage/methylation domain-containing protein
MKRDHKVQNAGFSLLEVVLVVAILVTFAAIALPRYGGAVARHRADLAARRVVTDLVQAQAFAQTTSAACTVSFSAATEQYDLLGVPSFDGNSADYRVDLSVDPYEAKLVSVDLGGDSQVVFDGWGMPDSGGTIVVSSGVEQRTVVIDGSSGQVTIQ